MVGKERLTDIAFDILVDTTKAPWWLHNGVGVFIWHELESLVRLNTSLTVALFLLIYTHNRLHVS